ncbi:MAG: TIGR00282 family metallophosphoesterase [bacterium]|nr:TIGR00282 family metallophosphoesterase [bacterium]
MRILFVGDIFGKPGRRVVSTLVPELKKSDNVDFVIVNGENSAGGFGITPKILKKFRNYGIDCVTSGNHIWDKKEIIPEFENALNLLRPANYPESAPGKGTQTFMDGKIGVINLSGKTLMPSIDCPFKTADREISKLNTPTIIVDFHAETCEEKRALAEYLDGRVSAIIGTHTHVQTADAQILPKGTAFITDAGMTGAFDSVIGVVAQKSINYFTLGVPQRFDTAKGNEQLNGVMLDIDENTGKAREIKALRINCSLPPDNKPNED